MEFIIVLFLAVIITALIYGIHKNKKEKQKANKDKTQEETINPEQQKPKYKLKIKTISDSEKYFLDILKKNFSNDYEIRPQVPLSSIIEKEKNFDREYQSELNRIVDIGIFDKTTTAPLLLIEINDKTHLQRNRRDRDSKVKNICDIAGIELITFWTNYENKEDYIVNRVREKLSKE